MRPAAKTRSSCNSRVLAYLHGVEVVPLGQPPPPHLRHPGEALGTLGFKLYVPDELDVAVCPIGMAEVPTFPSPQDRAYEVEVDGHRLLLQADSFEGFGAIKMDLYAHDQAPAKRELVRGRDVDGRATELTHRSGTEEHENPLIVNGE